VGEGKKGEDNRGGGVGERVGPKGAGREGRRAKATGSADGEEDIGGRRAGKGEREGGKFERGHGPT
jgi:hypothetical protein